MASRGETFLLYRCDHCEAPMFRSYGPDLSSGYMFSSAAISLQNHNTKQIEKVDVAICGSCGRITSTKDLFRIKNWKRVEYREV